MNKILLAFLLVVPTVSQAFTKVEKDCLTKTLYRECRGKGCSTEWSKLTSVILNRSKVWSKQHFKAKDASICSIVKSKEFSGRRLYNKPMKDKEVLEKIVKHLEKPLKVSTNAIFFRTVRGKMKYSGDYRTL